MLARRARRPAARGVMIAFVVNRLIHTIPVLLGVSVIAFLILRLAPGDPLQLMLPAYATQRDVEELRRSLGLDQSLVVQYFAWLGQVVQGNLGRSLFTSGSVLGEILERFPNTLILAVAAIGTAGDHQPVLAGDDVALAQRRIVIDIDLGEPETILAVAGAAGDDLGAIFERILQLAVGLAARRHPSHQLRRAKSIDRSRDQGALPNLCF